MVQVLEPLQSMCKTELNPWAPRFSLEHPWLWQSLGSKPSDGRKLFLPFVSYPLTVALSFKQQTNKQKTQTIKESFI